MSVLSTSMVIENIVVRSVVEVMVAGDVGSMTMAMENVGSVVEEAALVEV